MTYWELRKLVSKIVPRTSKLFLDNRASIALREKGRKKNYQEFDLLKQKWIKQERLLRTEEMVHFLEISSRAAACPMPFNLDVWDGAVCPFKCLYCFANAFRSSLYTAFYDNGKSIGIRHCNPTFYKKGMDKMDKYRKLPFESKKELTGINKAFALQIPLRLGIRFEDFLHNEKKAGISLTMLEYLRDIEYPVMINTKSVLVAEDNYLKAMSENPAKAAVHVTLISADNEVLKKLEPGAPSYEKRLNAMKLMVQAEIRVVARIEPYLFLINDDPEYVEKYITDLTEIGVKNITFDTYSFTAYSPNIRQAITDAGFDFDRLFLAGADSQPLGSLLLSKFMDLFRDRGFSCSTFDMGNNPKNNQSNCCEVGDWFEGGLNYGSAVMAARYIQEKNGVPVTWTDFEKYVDDHGGFLNDDLKMEVHQLWNMDGDRAYSQGWAVGIIAAGYNQNGLIWRYSKDEEDYRLQILNNLI